MEVVTLQSWAEVQRHRTAEHINLSVIFASNKIHFSTHSFSTGHVSVRTYIGAEKPNRLAPLDGKRAHISRMATDVGMHQLTCILNQMGAL
jgi:hypothetical protein